MLLQHTFPDPQTNLALELFLRVARDVLGDRLLSVILYGSIVFDDLAPGYGDLDFLAVTDADLSDETREQLIRARKPLRSGAYGQHCQMIEGAFLPRPMLDPAVRGSALWWGTSGDRPWTENRLGWLVLHVIRERGMTIYGADIRQEIPEADRAEYVKECGMFVTSAREHGLGGGLHSVDWLLASARMLLWLREGRLSSKSEAADWGYEHARGRWRELLPRAKQLRRSPALAESDDAKQWLDALTEPIQEAVGEVEEEVATQHR